MSAAIWSKRVTVEDGRALVAPPNLLDIYNAGIFREYLAAASAQSSSGDIVVMMGAVEVFDEDGLGCLVGALRRAATVGAAVYLLRTPQLVIDRLTRTGLLSQFKLIESLGELAPTPAPEVAPETAHV